jgi:DnaJ-class molecular chaperone
MAEPDERPAAGDETAASVIGERRIATVKKRVVCPGCGGRKKISHHGSVNRTDCVQCKGRGYIATDRGDVAWKFRQPLKPRPPRAK